MVSSKPVQRMLQLRTSWLFWNGSSQGHYDFESQEVFWALAGQENASSNFSARRRAIFNSVAASLKHSIVASPMQIMAYRVNPRFTATNGDAKRTVIQNSKGELLADMKGSQQKMSAFYRSTVVLWKVRSERDYDGDIFGLAAVLGEAQYISFSPDGQFVHGLTPKGDLKTWRVADLDWQPLRSGS